MPQGHHLDIENWPRRGIHDFFRAYELPFFGLCAEVDVTATRRWCAEKEESFFLASWYACQRAVNTVEEFRHRLRGEKVWVHDRIGIATTVAAENDTFRFCHLPCCDSFAEFADRAREIMAEAAPPRLDDRPHDDAMIHGSTVPWIRFTGLMHPRRMAQGDSVPKIVFGKVSPEGSRQFMPVAVEAHHSLIDGVHVARFLEHLEGDLARPEGMLGGRDSGFSPV